MTGGTRSRARFLVRLATIVANTPDVVWARAKLSFKSPFMQVAGGKVARHSRDERSKKERKGATGVAFLRGKILFSGLLYD